ncbi:hypothetical protein B0H16DRAFT_1467667 [Mycena metata]|uniref:Uncharacterized protein n=1 Tax=Mycena metata TaxID=1033252 RepID=A0AAD7I3M0_9AGAR|nr:hypothetical protein B0H16DRAFT_1467667 [Mycena metata]
MRKTYPFPGQPRHSEGDGKTVGTLPGGKTLGNLRLFPAKESPRNDRFLVARARCLLTNRPLRRILYRTWYCLPPARRLLLMLPTQSQPAVSPSVHRQYNVDDCTAVVQSKYPNLVRNIQLVTPFFPLTHAQKRKLKTSRGQAEVITSTMLCICTEQTFTQASAHKESFVPAFSTALDAYLASTMKEAVNNAIAALPAEDFEQVLEDREHSRHLVNNVAPKLVDIIQNHRLRKKAMFV